MTKSADVIITDGKATDDSYSVIIRTSLILVDGTNPVERTSPRKLRKLKESVESIGVQEEIHLVHIPPKYLYVVADGHRRLAVSNLLEYPFIRARVHTIKTPDYWWSLLNGDVKERIIGSQWLEKWLKSNCKCLPPKSTLARIKRTADIFGGNVALKKLCATHKISPEICNVVDLVYGVLERQKSKIKSVPSKYDIGLWLLEHKEQQHMRRVMEPIKTGEINGTKATSLARKVKKLVDKNEPWPYPV